MSVAFFPPLRRATTWSLSLARSSGETNPAAAQRQVASAIDRTFARMAFAARRL